MVIVAQILEWCYNNLSGCAQAEAVNSRLFLPWLYRFQRVPKLTHFEPFSEPAQFGLFFLAMFGSAVQLFYVTDESSAENLFKMLR